ncbi:MAG: hypothetical protein ABI280_00910 [Ginsengibacter sp.]
MKRKKFIYLSIGGALAIATPTLYCSYRDKTLNKALRQPKFLSSICDAKTLDEIGTAYINKYPAEKKEDQLTGLLLADSTGQPIVKTADLPLLLDQKIIDDFKTGKTVVVDGWVLSITEARQCAFLTLVKK